MKKKVIAGIIGVVAVIAIATGIAVSNQKPEQTTTTATVEAGEEFNPAPADYFTGKHVSDIKFDTKKVNTDKVGEYKATATYKKNDYTITVTVKDTTAPEITAKSTDPVYTKDITTIKPEDYVTVEDVSDTTIEITGYQKLDAIDAEPTTEATTTTPEEEGFYKATITATDSSNNESDTTITVVYDKTAPTIEGLADTTVETEPTEDQFNPTATDAIDGAVEVTKSVEKTGDNQYTITAKATDKAGNEATQSAIITVAQPVAEQPAQETASTETTTKKSNNSSNSSSSSNSGSSSSQSSSSSSSSSTQSSQQSQASASSESAPASQPAQEAQQPVESTPAESAPAEQPAQEAQPSTDNSSSSSSSSSDSSNDSLDRYREQDAIKSEQTDWECGWCGIEFGYGASGEAAFAAHMKDVHGLQ